MTLVDHLALGGELLELAHVGADDEALLLAGDEDEAADATCRARPASTRSTMAPSSSSGRRPSEFWLSPSRSNTAQAMPCRSMEKRQSRNVVHDLVMVDRCQPHSAAALCARLRALCPAVM